MGSISKLDTVVALIAIVTLPVVIFAPGIALIQVVHNFAAGWCMGAVLWRGFGNWGRS